MSLLHYCCKAGAPGIGDAETAASFARQLLALGADPNLRSRWTNMRALHYAAYFDVPQLVGVMLQASEPGEVDATCSDFDFGTALHIAASNLCTSVVKCLLEFGANPAFKNDKGQCPADVVPDPLDMPLEMADAAAVAKELRTLLRRALPRPSSPLPLTLQGQVIPALSDKAKMQLASMGIRLGDCVVIAGQKVGTLRFCGSTEFSGGLWAGVELDKPEGKNDGSVAGVQYFTCRVKHGIFAPLSKISKPLEKHKSSTTKTPLRPPRRIDVSRITSKINTGILTRSLSSSSSSLDSRQGPSGRPRPLPRQRLLARQRKENISPSPRTKSSPAHHSSFRSSAPPAAGFRSRTPSGSSSLYDGSEVRLGERVLVAGQRTGVVKFCGKTNFAHGIWLGIELDKPSGKNDGSVGGVRYFSCPPKHGVFAPPSRVQRICKATLTDIIRHFDENGARPRLRKKSQRPQDPDYISSEQLRRVLEFIKNYAEDHTIMLPGRHPGHRDWHVKLLLTHVSKASVWRLYMKSAKELGERAVCKSSFKALWTQLLPHIRSCRPRTDLCWKCQQNNDQLIRSANLPEEWKTAAIKKQEDHLQLVQKDRAVYNETKQKLLYVVVWRLAGSAQASLHTKHPLPDCWPHQICPGLWQTSIPRGPGSAHWQILPKLWKTALLKVASTSHSQSDWKMAICNVYRVVNKNHI
ncbi:CAP-Gly domain-containing linker protein 4-like isoform X3 [Girardinichthys multiradiatus]|nr:CAP-Gly domain-containing linker protein 4-like isoform X3 [Girardinichthys multiradiatus]